MSAELEAVIRSASNVWIEQTETDREVLRQVQAGTIAECVRYLNERGFIEAANNLESIQNNKCQSRASSTEKCSQ